MTSSSPVKAFGVILDRSRVVAHVVTSTTMLVGRSTARALIVGMGRRLIESGTWTWLPAAKAGAAMVKAMAVKAKRFMEGFSEGLISAMMS